MNESEQGQADQPLTPPECAASLIRVGDDSDSGSLADMTVKKERILSLLKGVTVKYDSNVAPFKVKGGAENGLLITVGEVVTASEELHEDDVIFSVNGLHFPGKTLLEAQQTLKLLSLNNSELQLEVINKGVLTADIRELFKDQTLIELHMTMRDNILLNSVPYTTRPRYTHEVDGEDYIFVSNDEFQRLQKAHSFLECGEFEGYLYATPRPNAIMNGDPKGPLPPNWDISYTDSGEKYFIDHNNGTTQWNDPRDTVVSNGHTNGYPFLNGTANDTFKLSSNGYEEALPDGWEKVEDEVHGTFYVDHINKRTQYERPSKQNGYVETGVSPNSSEPLLPAPVQHGHAGTSNENGWHVNGSGFTCDPAQLKGELITTRLTKGPQGLGFTLVGNDRHSIQNEFIQIKSVLPRGPAALDNVLHTGDVLVYVNNELMLGASQDTACRLLRSVGVGETVTIQICRGYPLILDHTNKVYDEAIYSSTYAQTNFQARNSERIEIMISKSQGGFGFTITDSLQGQRVKSVMKPDQCPNLLEGDLIIEVDGVNVLGMSHVQLVQFLHELPIGYSTTIIVTRQSPRLGRSRTPTAGFKFGEKTRSTPLPSLGPRSKTPAPSLKRNNYQQSTLQRSLHDEMIDEFAQLRGTMTRNGFSSTPDYIPISSLSPMIDSTYKFITVNLIQHNGGFGFRLVGGVEMGVPLKVGSVVKGGAAFQDGRLREEDEICEIDGKNVVGFQHDVVVALIKQAALRGYVKILVKRRQRDNYGTLRSNYQVSNYADPRQFLPSSLVYDVVLNKNEHEDFGCTIVPGIYRFIGKVIPNSPAARSGRLQAGDCVVAINGLATDEMSHQDVINYVKSCRKSIVFTIDPTKQRNLLMGDGSASPMSILRDTHSPISTTNIVQGNGLQYLNGVEKDFKQIQLELKKGAKGFGFSIRGGFEFENMPLFILRIAEDGPAAQEGTLRVGDQLVEINGESTAGMTHQKAISLIREQNVVRLVVSRPHVPK
ncbi:unnamed protein product [Bursaphelenchus okinawaensis]|uniref:Uncharacterized protein n=1 Tax=Bursaphelenchus okinawaensis TaxID=465554 RepID=A0A811KWN5_9BILA|nr:unnamed protein product [Bursaphelenchus okinawaensis]CAG9113090.1 unnamed protein product [Bursaphelenchus okinawaensis]